MSPQPTRRPAAHLAHPARPAARPARPAARRSILAVGLALPLGAVLAACGSDTSERYESGYVSGDGVATEIPPADRGDAVDITGTTYDGEEFSAADVRGEVLVLNVWYASCPPCRKEAPDLQAIHEDYSAQNVVMIGVNVRDDAGPAQAFEKTYGITYPSIPDEGAEIMYALRGQVAPNAVPSTLVIDRDGRVAARISGAIDPSVLRTMIDTVIDE